MARRTVQLEEAVKDHLASLHDLYGFKTHSDTLEFILLQHDKKVKDTMPAIEMLYYKQCKSEGKPFV